MAAGASSRIIHCPSKLVVDPTDLTIAYPYGGTEIGKTRDAGFQSLGETFGVWSEALGEITDVLEGSNAFLFACFARGWDDDAVANFRPGGYAAGAVSGHAVFTEPGNRMPGQSALQSGSARDVVLLLVPDDVIHVPATIMYRAIPDWSPGSELAFRRRDEFGLPLMFKCLRNSVGNIYQQGILADLSLT